MERLKCYIELEPVKQILLAAYNEKLLRFKAICNELENENVKPMDWNF